MCFLLYFFLLVPRAIFYAFRAFILKLMKKKKYGEINMHNYIDYGEM